MRILFATDGSENAAEAAGLLARFKALQPMDITFLSVTYDPDPDTEAVRPWYPEYRKHIEERVENHFHRIQELLQTATRNAHMLHLHGNPTKRILEAVEQVQPDLLVLGARGHSALESLLLGSVSEAVTSRASCSVLVMRPRDGELERDPCEPKKILLACDGSKQSDMAGQELLSLVKSHEAEVDILAVATSPPYLFGEYTYAGDWPEQLATLERVLAKESLRYANSRGKVETHAGTANHVGDTIVKYATETAADLIILGESGHNAFEKLFLGSTTKFVLRHADCSVWISRTPAWKSDAEVNEPAQTKELEFSASTA